MREPTKINDGGRAFPVHPGSNPDGGSAGMSLRDWFAGQALAGILASPNESVYRMVIETTRDASPAPITSRLSYELADAMLAAREAPNA